MSLRQQAKILGIVPSYLSMMVNGKRPWKSEIMERYNQLVNTNNRVGAKSWFPERNQIPIPIQEADFKLSMPGPLNASK